MWYISRAFAESSSGFGCVHSAVGVLHGLFGCLYMALNSAVALKVKIRGTIRLLAYGVWAFNVQALRAFIRKTTCVLLFSNYCGSSFRPLLQTSTAGCRLKCFGFGLRQAIRV